MSNPAWTDAVRDALHKRLAMAIKPVLAVIELANWMHPLSPYWLVAMRNGDETGVYLTKWRLTAGKIGLDTDANGMCWGDVTDETPGANQARVRVYADSVRTVLVAQGNAANGAVLTLVPETGYTLAGPLTLGTIVGNFNFAFELIPPLLTQARVIFDATQPDDNKVFADIEDMWETGRTSLLAAAVAMEDAGALVMRLPIARNLPIQKTADTLIDEGVYLADGETGEVKQAASGLEEDLRLAQKDNLSGTGEIKAGAPTQTGTITYPGTWQGRTTGGPTLNVRAVPGVASLRCTKELDESAPQFALVFVPSDVRRKLNNGLTNLTTSFPLTLGQNFKAPELGIDALLIDYAPVIDNDGATNGVNETSSLWSARGLTSLNSDNGKVWFAYEMDDTTLRFYKSEEGRDDRDEDEVVATAVVTLGATVFETTENASGLVITGKTDDVPADNDTGYVDFSPPTQELPESYFVLTIAETVEPSAWVRAMRDGVVGGARWRPNTGATPNLQDGWIMAGTPIPYKVIDGLPI